VCVCVCVCSDEDRPAAPADLTYSNVTLTPNGKVTALLTWRRPQPDSRFIVDKYKVHASCCSRRRRTGHFLERGWIDFARKIWGSARKMNSRTRTNMIKQDETRKLDYIDCGKSLKNLYLHLRCPFIINIR